MLWTRKDRDRGREEAVLDRAIAEWQGGRGKDASTWAVLSRSPDRLDALAKDPRWTPAGEDRRFLWTDDDSNVLEVLRFPKLR